MTTPAKAAKPDVRLLLAVKRGNGYHIVTVRADVVTMTSEGIRSPLWHSSWSAEQYPQDAEAYDSLTVRAQHNADDAEPRWYGYEICYQQPYTVDLDRAQSMVRVLKRADARLTALTAKFGYCETFAAYLARVADALGCTSSAPFGRKVMREHDYDGSGYRWMDASAVARYLADELEASKPKAAAA